MNGLISLRIEGLMLEKLIARAMSEGAVFRRIDRPDSRLMEIQADPASAQILCDLCERFSIRCEILSRRGQDAVLRRLKSRATLIAGILICLACMSMFLSRVWIVDVELTDGRSGSTETLASTLSEMGIHPGMVQSDLDAGLLEEELAARAPDYSFIGVRLQGVRLLIEATPAVAEPELYALENARDLVAQCDGVVLSVRVLSGIPCVQPGDTVVRGQTLIRGEERISKEENRGVSALGDVIARTWHEGTACAPIHRTETTYTGRHSTSSHIRLLRFEWPLLEGETYPTQKTETEILPIGGLFLPFEIRRTIALETQNRTVECDETALHAALARMAFADAGIKLTQSHPGNCEIADRWIEYTQSGGLLTARAVYETHTNIAVTRDALYQQGGSHIGND